jgi:tRNA/rRNA methyltransferase
MGLSDLRLVAPRRYRSRAAAQMAVHASDILERVKPCRSLGEVIADCGWVVGTTCRPGPYRARALSPREAAPQILSVCSDNRVALVFGPEDHGLSNDELKLCHELVTIPTDSGYASLNLAQAVLVCVYELFLARRPRRSPAPALATSDRLERMYGNLGHALVRIGFLHGANPEHIMFTVRRIFGRARLDPREVAIWLGIARQIEWFAEEARGVVENKRNKGIRLK